MRHLPLDHPGTADTRSPGRFLVWMARGQWRTLVVAMLFGIVWMGTQAVMPAVIGRAIDAGVASRDLSALAAYAGLMLVIGLVQAGSGVATLGLPDSPGVTASTAADTLTVEFNDLPAAEALFAAQGEQIAAVIVEPIAANMGFVLPEPGFLEGLQRLARAHNIPIVVTSTLSRASEARADKVPMLYDLRNAGDIEDVADAVIFVHRDDMYEAESTRPGEADLIVAKHRHGPTRTIVVAFQGHYSRFVDIAPRTSTPTAR